jgi:hypothetical protein
MQLISFYITLPFCTSTFLMMYQVVAILLLVGTLFKNKIKSESYNLLYVFNTLAAWSSLLVILAYVAELFIAWYGQNPYEWYAFSEPADAKYLIWLFIINILSFLLGLLFFFRKLRISRWFTLLFYLSCCSFLFERIVIFITGLYRDYLPSSWSVNSGDMYPKYVYSFGLIIILVLTIYVWAKKKRRLPFPSVFLK